MIKINYHASHEQFSPRELLALARLAESAGFDGAFSSDHIHPWAPAQGQSGFIWAWLGAALQATERLSFAGITIPGGWRYHPAVTAQAIATLGELFPGRLPWIALGSGEALNECVTGTPWPDKTERNERLQESAHIIRELWSGARVTRSGVIPVRNAQIWSLPRETTQLMGAALTAATAEWVGTWADGLLTVATRLESAAEIVQAFKRNGQHKPMHAKIDLSWAPTEELALAQAHEQWRFHAVDRSAIPNLETPEQFERAAETVTPEKMRGKVLISSDPFKHVDWLQERIALGFDSLDIHNVGTNQREFIETFGQHVLPALRRDLHHGL